MGQKVNPIGIRLGITRDWTSSWYAGKRQFPAHVHTDFRVREFLKKKLADASVSRIMIERAAKKVNITIQTARPGIVIGKKGEDIEKLRQRDRQAPRHARQRRAAQHRRDPQARARRAAGRRGHRAADREARDVPPRHEARRDEHHALGRAGHQGAHLRPPERLGNRAHRVVSRGTRFRCTPSAPTSTTAWPRRRPPTASSASRCGSSRARCSTRPSSSSRPPRANAAQAPAAAAPPPQRRRRQCPRPPRQLLPHRLPPRPRRNRVDAATEAHQVPQAVQGPQRRAARSAATPWRSASSG